MRNIYKIQFEMLQRLYDEDVLTVEARGPDLVFRTCSPLGKQCVEVFTQDQIKELCIELNTVAAEAKRTYTEVNDRMKAYAKGEVEECQA